MSLVEQVRGRLIRAGELGLTRYRIAQLTGIQQSALSRFANGQAGLSLEHLDLLADLLGLRVTMSDAHVRQLVRTARAERQPAGRKKGMVERGS